MTNARPARRPLGSAWFVNWALIVWAGTMVVFCSLPLLNYSEVHAGHNKDYPIWYKAGRNVVEGRSIYSLAEREGKQVLEFMYPPSAALFLAPWTVFGERPFIVFLVLLNSTAWVACVLMSVRLSRAVGNSRSIWIYALPTIFTVSYVYDSYLLGQPNLLLLAMLLGAFWCLEQRRDWSAGALIAFATASKAFPLLAVGYLVYRRKWRATAATLAFLAAFVFVIPASFRGVQRTSEELKIWANGMLFHYDARGIAQRPEASYEWKNGSLIAVTHRLLRMVPAEFTSKGDPVYVNVANLGFHWISAVIVAVATLLGLGCMLIAPSQQNRTRATNRIEYALLLVLMIIFSPISWFYYGVWLMYPLAVVAQFIGSENSLRWQRNLAIGWLVASLLLLNAIFPWLGTIRAVGFPFFGYLVLLGELSWMLWLFRRPSFDTNLRASHGQIQTDEWPFAFAGPTVIAMP